MAPAKANKSGRSTAKGKGKGKGRIEGSCASSTTDGSSQGPKEAEDSTDLRRHVQQAYREALSNEGKVHPRKYDQRFLHQGRSVKSARAS